MTKELVGARLSLKARGSIRRNLSPTIFQLIRQQPRALVIGEALLLIGLIGWVDLLTGWEWNSFAPLALPIILVTWKVNRRAGFAFTVLCVLTFAAAHYEDHPYQTQSGFLLAVFGRWFYFLVLVVAVAAVKDQRESDRARIATLEHMRQLEGEILGACEREQQRLGRDLHDNLGSHLAGIGYAATFLSNELRAEGAPAAAKAEQIRDLVSEAVTLTRDLAHAIVPVSLEGAGLSVALEDLARSTSGITGKAISFSESGETNIENADNGLHLYRIAQEAVNNAVQHGDASTIRIGLQGKDGSLRLTVDDDGNGLRAGAEEAHGMGIHSMRYRARILGAGFKIDSGVDRGTRVSCEMANRPVPARP